MTRPSIELCSPRPLANILPIRPMAGTINKYNLNYPAAFSNWNSSPAIARHLSNNQPLISPQCLPSWRAQVTGYIYPYSRLSSSQNSTQYCVYKKQSYSWLLFDTSSPNFICEGSNITRFYSYWAIGLMSRVFANVPGHRGSIPARVIPKTQKMVHDAILLNPQHYKVRIKWSNWVALPKLSEPLV